MFAICLIRQTCMQSDVPGSLWECCLVCVHNKPHPPLLGTGVKVHIIIINWKPNHTHTHTQGAKRDSVGVVDEQLMLVKRAPRNTLWSRRKSIIVCGEQHIAWAKRSEAFLFIYQNVRNHKKKQNKAFFLLWANGDDETNESMACAKR